MVGGHEIVATPLAGSRGALDEPRPLVGEEASRVVVQPSHVAPSGQGHRQEDELADAVGMALGVRERERHAPRAAQDEPLLDAEVLTEPLDVGDEVVGRVGDEGLHRLGGRRQGSTRHALVEGDDSIAIRIEPSTRSDPRRGAGPPVEDERRLAGRVAHGLPVHAVAVADVEQIGPIRQRQGIADRHGLPATIPDRPGRRTADRHDAC